MPRQSPTSNHQGGSRSHTTQREADSVLGKTLCSALFTVHIPGVENWQMDFLSNQHLDRRNALPILRCSKLFTPSEGHRIFWHPGSTTNWTDFSPGPVTLVPSQCMLWCFRDISPSDLCIFLLQLHPPLLCRFKMGGHCSDSRCT